MFAFLKGPAIIFVLLKQICHRGNTNNFNTFFIQRNMSIVVGKRNTSVNLLLDISWGFMGNLHYLRYRLNYQERRRNMSPVKSSIRLKQSPADVFAVYQVRMLFFTKFISHSIAIRVLGKFLKLVNYSFITSWYFIYSCYND